MAGHGSSPSSDRGLKMRILIMLKMSFAIYSPAHGKLLLNITSKQGTYTEISRKKARNEK